MTFPARPSGRAPDQLRDVRIERGFTRHAEGSVLVAFGDTRVLCTASVDNKAPGFLRGKGEGWVTAEYGMLPRATNTRNDREAARGKQGGRTLEIQRLIGRSLRVCVDLGSMPYSAVTQPSPEPRLCGGTLSSTEAVHSTWVSPNAMSTEPSAWRVKWRVMATGRKASAARPWVRW